MMVGVDLGTTNSALAYVDPAEAAVPTSLLFACSKYHSLCDEGRVEMRPLLPSFSIPWRGHSAGVYAREQALWFPRSVVTSAKSWFIKSGGRPHGKDSPLDARDPKRSVSGRSFVEFLAHLRHAWDNSQPVLSPNSGPSLPVPASFDEEARD